MANVGFKMGVQEALETIHENKTAIEGTFYLTSDSNRLYIGKGDGTVAPVNEGVITVDKVENLPSVSDADLTAGSFYYAKEDNILCVYNGQQCVQVNSVVTNTGVANTVATIEGVATVTTSVTDSLNQTKSGSFSIKGADGISIESNGTTITISGSPVELKTAEVEGENAAIIQHVHKDGTAAGAAKIIGGTNVTVEGSEDGIVISAEDLNTTNSSVAVTNGAESGFIVSVTDSDNKTVSGGFDPIIKIGKTESEVKFVSGVADLDVYTIGEVDAIKEGLEEQLAQELKAFNAMEYQGTVGAIDATVGTELPTEGVKNGFSYLVTGDNFSFDGTSYPAGTLVVAQGEESEETGFIPAEEISWAFVTGSTSDTTYSGHAVAGGIALQRSTDNAVVMKLTAEAGDIEGIGLGEDIKITSSASTGSEQVLTIAHKRYSDTLTGTADTAPEAMTAMEGAYEIPVISDIIISNGHVTGYKTKTYTVTDTNATLSGVATEVSNVTDGVSIKNSVSLTNSINGTTTKDASFSLQSSSLVVEANEAKTGMSINLVWGEF